MWKTIRSAFTEYKDTFSEKFHNVLNKTELDDKAKAFGKDVLDKASGTKFGQFSKNLVQSATTSLEDLYHKATSDTNKEKLHSIWDKAKTGFTAGISSVKNKAAVALDRVKASEFWKQASDTTQTDMEYQG